MYMATNLLIIIIIIIIRNIEKVLCGTVEKGGWYLRSNVKSVVDDANKGNEQDLVGTRHREFDRNQS